MSVSSELVRPAVSCIMSDSFDGFFHCTIMDSHVVLASPFSLGILSGIAIGIAANYLLRHVQTLQRFQKIMSREPNKMEPNVYQNNRHKEFYEATSNVGKLSCFK